MLGTLMAGSIAAAALTVGTAIPAEAKTSNFSQAVSERAYFYSGKYRKTSSPKKIWLQVTYIKNKRANAYVTVVNCKWPHKNLGPTKYKMKVGKKYQLTTKTLKKGTCFQIKMGQGYAGHIKGKLSY
ncbi:hypothetical protein ACH34W_53680 [Actinomadura sp. 6N118]